MTLVRNEKDYLAAMKHCKVRFPDPWVIGKNASATAHWLQHPTDGLCVIVAIRVTTQSIIEVYGLLVHEAVHVAQAYFEDIAEHNPAKEQQAYAIQNIAQILMQDYERQTGEDKK